MDDGGQHENGRHNMDYFRGPHTPWNMMPQQHQGKEQNALAMNKKIMSILAERDAAIREWNQALNEKKEALAARDAALAQREKALAERDEALMERDNALAALQYRESAISFPFSNIMQREAKRMHHPSSHLLDNHLPDMVDVSNYIGDAHLADAFPTSSISSETVKSCKRKRQKENKSVLSKAPKSPRKVKKMGEDLNRQVPSEGKKYKTEWDSHDVGLNLIAFDESTMPGPVCSCTGIPRQCYKWGNGGWQSSCCTTTISQYPLPQMQNKRHTRLGGRKMSGSVFTRLLSRLAAKGHDLLVPLDLKDYWARHGTNRYITIK